MCGEFGEVTGIIDFVIIFLADGTLFFNSYGTLSYVFVHSNNLLTHVPHPSKNLLQLKCRLHVTVVSTPYRKRIEPSHVLVLGETQGKPPYDAALYTDLLPPWKG